MMAFGDDEHFPDLVDAILPFVSPDDGIGIMVPPPGAREGQIFERCPEHVLALLWADSKVAVRRGHGLHRLWKQLTRTRRDSRMIELMRSIGRGP
jgi:hypothetical protein